jgi:Na+/H+-dicarboxylate symporter
VSVLIKDLLIWLLPITIGLFISQVVCSFHKQAPLFICTLIIFEALSNLSSVWYAYTGGHIISNLLPNLDHFDIHSNFALLWRLPFTKPNWWSPDKGAILGLIIGCIGALWKNDFLYRCIYSWKQKAEWILTHIFSKLIPLFILGFVARMHQTHMLEQMFAHYGMLLLFLFFFLGCYVFIIFLAGCNFSLITACKKMSNLLPAGAIAFSSGCSLSTMPFTISGTAKNLTNPELAKAVIPATTNIQQVGDCIANSFLCFLLYQHFFGHPPDFLTWTSFSIVFVLARFATAAVLGGAVFIMLPIYESYLSFNPEMIAIILAFNVILDPIITACNVIANGALCQIFEKVWNRVLPVEKHSSKTN